ncbi:Tetratricopeptide TPR_2 repeat protein [Chloroherpeton thalassium ATCC 35110]|uniref:Tetratricopeptide TPR_2 repeat protein n=1 Tax=Chloroherpeton thalassium (strain ATCC 35110 / GB-78) TaxID=517418 RepID=B3QT31_CHLT3|nr:tetratricopeptide repeat protein [Chloroherpeton thalassium]ACF12674.1 Tetratricopeptide TPR_2 repeat protein [Chloroherpeton thalassium ATCC 35110]
MIYSRFKKAFLFCGLLLAMFGCGVENGLQKLEQKVWANPNDVEAQFNLGKAYGSIGDYEKAATTLKKVTELDSTHPVAYSALGAAYFMLERYDDAIQAFQSAKALQPKDPEKSVDLGNAYFNAKKFPEAISEYKTALALDSTLHEVYYNLGMSYAKNGQKSEALHAYEILKTYNSYLASSLQREFIDILGLEIE